LPKRALLHPLILLLFAPFLFAAAPGIALQDFSGKERHFREFLGRGQWVIVVAWSKDCPICKRDIHHMTFFHDEHKDREARVLGLSVDGLANRRQAQAFIDDHDLNFPNLIGDPLDASRLSGKPFIGTPTYYFFDPQGELVSVHVGSVTQAQAEEMIRRFKAQRTRD
jgi:peroxiredoxin